MYDTTLTLAILGTFILGAIVGSFLNVVVYRYNTGVSLGGRSYCFSCGKKLSWHELVPIISFIIQRGRCRGCGSRISLQYPAVEIIAGMLFALVPIKFFSYALDTEVFLSALFYIVAVSVLLAITVYDIRHKIIPNGLVYLFGGVSFVYMIISAISIPETAEYNLLMWNLFAGPLLALPFAFLWAISKGRWMGLGDAKLALGIGWFLGLSSGVVAILLAFWIGAVVGVLLIVLSKVNSLFLAHKTFTIKSEIPFGPFMVLGFIIAWFFEVDFTLFSSLLIF